MHNLLIGAEMPLDAYDRFEVRHCEMDAGEVVRSQVDPIDFDPAFEYCWTVYAVCPVGVAEAIADFESRMQADALALALNDPRRVLMAFDALYAIQRQLDECVDGDPRLGAIDALVTRALI
jgi:hypothetical protein